MGGTSTCWMPFFAVMDALILAAAAAAAAAASFLLSPLAGLSTLFATGLRSRPGSELLRLGDADLLSKRDLRAGSAWSKRDLLGRSSSAMLTVGQVPLETRGCWWGWLHTPCVSSLNRGDIESEASATNATCEAKAPAPSQSPTPDPVFSRRPMQKTPMSPGRAFHVRQKGC